MLFDILKFHGASFSPQFWLRVFDSVLLPIFDHVRAEVSQPSKAQPGAGGGCCWAGGGGGGRGRARVGPQRACGAAACVLHPPPTHHPTRPHSPATCCSLARQVTDTTTFTDDKRRAEVDSWLYDTCTRTLQHIVDLVVQYYAAVAGEPASLLTPAGLS